MLQSPSEHEIFVHGVPAPQGSKRLVRVKGRTIMLEASRRVKPWREQVAACAEAAGVLLHEGDVRLDIVAWYQRPASHFTRRGKLVASAPRSPGYADCDKLARAVCDALAGIAYRNDRQVYMLTVERRWCCETQVPGARIRIFGA